MSLTSTTLIMMSVLFIPASAHGPIIEVPKGYDQTSPWEQLAALGLANLTETDCQRECEAGKSPRICIYTLSLEFYSAMGTACGNCSKGVLKDCFRSQCIPADGYERGVMSINRMIPGPQIHICKNDVLVILVQNKMAGTGATIHWHGLLQKNSQWMDGVPYVSQCPIGQNTFRYVFTVEESGTYFYHSHSGHHRANGNYGALIIREPRVEEVWLRDIYDMDLPEHTIVISDWMHYTAEMFYPGLPTLQPGITPSTILINGLGWYRNATDDTTFNSHHPIAIFHVKRGKRYRFRIINADNLVCPVLMQIQDHKMTLIATDGKSIKPVVIDGFVSYAGERFDVVVDTGNNKLKKNSFWIHFRGLASCSNLDQYAVLSYGTNVNQLGIIPEGRRPTSAKPLPINTIVNHPNITCAVSPKHLCVSDLKTIGRKQDEDILTSEPDVRLLIRFGFHRYENVDAFHKMGTYRKFMNLEEENIRSAIMNNITFKFPSTPSLSSRNVANPEYCSPDNLPAKCKSTINDNSIPYCECPHFVTVKQNDIIEMTFVNDDFEDTAVDHPIHLHGHGFYVAHIYREENRTAVYSKDEIHNILRRLEDNVPKTYLPALKDSVSVAMKAFVTVKFRADNPGDWLMHCHFEWHGNVGMMMVIRVQGKIAPKPPGYPTCGNFDPLLHVDE